MAPGLKSGLFKFSIENILVCTFIDFCFCSLTKKNKDENEKLYSMYVIGMFIHVANFLLLSSSFVLTNGSKRVQARC